MSNQDSRQTNAYGAHDNITDSSDLLSMLKVIEQLFDASRVVINSHSSAAIFLALIVEVQTLLTKLRAMRQRWSVHLPFKEASTVDLVSWSNRVAQLASIIQSADSRYCLDPDNAFRSSHCLLDIYEKAVEATRDNSAKIDLSDPTQLLNRHASMLEDLNTQRERCVDAISQLILNMNSAQEGLNISSLSNMSLVRTSCAGCLKELSSELLQLHEQLVKIFSDKDYERLAERILLEPEYEGPTVRREARDIMYNWRNGVPAGKLEEYRKAQIEQTREDIRKTKHGAKLEQYVDLNADFLSQRSEFGRFLFNRRKDMTRAELRELMLLVYSVYYYQKEIHSEACQPVGETEADDSATQKSFPPLPVEFDQKLRDSQTATMRLYRILIRIEPYINNSGTKVPGSTPELCAHYKDWTWCHLFKAFEQMGYLSKNSNKAAFAKFIHSLFPHRTEKSVQRSLYRNNNVNSPNIVADIVKEFKKA